MDPIHPPRNLFERVVSWLIVRVISVLARLAGQKQSEERDR